MRTSERAAEKEKVKWESVGCEAQMSVGVYMGADGEGVREGSLTCGSVCSL